MDNVALVLSKFKLPKKLKNMEKTPEFRDFILWTHRIITTKDSTARMLGLEIQRLKNEKEKSTNN